MIAIKDAKWEVQIKSYPKVHYERPINSSNIGCYWQAMTKCKVGLQIHPIQEGQLKTKSGCKRHWLRFAKLNKIPEKNWRYV